MDWILAVKVSAYHHAYYEACGNGHADRNGDGVGYGNEMERERRGLKENEEHSTALLSSDFKAQSPLMRSTQRSPRSLHQREFG